MDLFTKAEAMEIGQILSQDFSKAGEVEEFETISQCLLGFIQKKIGRSLSWEQLEELPILAPQLRPAVHVLSMVCNNPAYLVIPDDAFESLYFLASYLIECRSLSGN